MTRREKLLKLKFWVKFYWVKFILSFLVVAFAIKGVPATGLILLLFSVGALILFFMKYEEKRSELGLNND